VSAGSPAWEKALDAVGDEQAAVAAIVYAELLVGVRSAAATTSYT
jgi:hypothetical protein